MRQSRNFQMYVIRLCPERGIDGIKALRWLLKKAGRLGLKAVSVVEESDERGNNQNREDTAHARRSE
jgi:hypothetical protein